MPRPFIYRDEDGDDCIDPVRFVEIVWGVVFAGIVTLLCAAATATYHAGEWVAAIATAN